MPLTLAKSEKVLCLFFLLSLLFLNPVVRGDGVGYYAFARALVVQHDLHFEKDWRAGYPNLAWGNPDGKGNVNPLQYTTTGHLDNYFAIGPAILWAPYLIVAHLGVLSANALGAHVSADGFSRPYLLAMALGTALYGFLALLFSLHLVRKYFEERWALLATLAIWLASSLPFYIYCEPSWSHAHSAFGVALFLWYWDRTRPGRTIAQWSILGLCAGLMIDVYFVNAAFLLLPFLESFAFFWRALRASPAGKQSNQRDDRYSFGRLLAASALFVVFTTVALLPTFFVKYVIYGSPIQRGGYLSPVKWQWASPHLFSVLFSSDHGLLSWNPILILALLGLVFSRKRAGDLSKFLLASFCVFYYVIASYPLWNGVTAFGNRYFISFTPAFVLGLACALEYFAKLWRNRQASLVRATVIVALVILWNIGFIFQFATHMIPERGPVPWHEMIYNQFRIVPHDLPLAVWHRLTGR